MDKSSTIQTFYKITNERNMYIDYEGTPDKKIITRHTPPENKKTFECRTLSEGAHVIKDNIENIPVSTFFVKPENLHKYITLGTHVVEIYVDLSSATLRVKKIGNCYFATEFIVGKRYYLLDIDIVLMFNKKSVILPFSSFYIDSLSASGDVTHLNKWYDRSKDAYMRMVDTQTDNHENNRNLMGYNWWKESPIPLLYTEASIDYASEYQYTAVLAWWVDKKLPLLYSEKAFEEALSAKKENSYNWWCESKLPLKYTEDIIVYAVIHKDFNILNRWRATAPGIIKAQTYYQQYFILVACSKSSDMKKWWKLNGNELGYKHEDDLDSDYVRMKYIAMVKHYRDDFNVIFELLGSLK